MSFTTNGFKAGDPIGKWLPELPAAQAVTLEMLINDTAGYHPDKDFTVTIWCTKSIDFKSDSNPVSALFIQVTSILTPDK